MSNSANVASAQGGASGGSTSLNAVPESAVPSTSSISRVPANESVTITRTAEPLNETNWAVWKADMCHMFKLCGIAGYIYGDVTRPDPALDPVSADNWDFNDTYAARIIFSNLAALQKIHVGQDCSAHEMWDNLEAIHEATGHTTIINYVRLLFKCNVEEGDDIIEHLSNLRVTFERIHALSNQEEFKISDLFFKVIISSSLPPSWDNYT